ncbi:conserved Plasmodium protein, unknown function [Plasmodium knowlesi strain H]|uniref:Uncharacterized protein n=3 Tax=Plasmodium knowlesi TaxID=5850 RepID=A0A5K1UUH3_PLAKH|nr:conserved Plasmodium protein, unknown function [Plasmodium knowlesi strain H]OTN64042.1 Uncharacterized protein PKNOH_S140265100 [Plasmodium knowlesi]CAA9991065.1 conserved Plasmodium protein, unknown function [Plasmodium knowlesi strain H]SBO20645.1 conserved Plasmodium protein, unknown function [Plasmodium knowlesi strain H]SBO21059.1 conserved Plasmodium protein, unknown function [Plasmodium knowlesi strain H]VVS80539.1 conserved Plasmodium protein, unknown function [Plasmodium knowlesi |eukprot:XP_002262347.1 hypothetical protein, conserved in Plasmodium species [Plasmodium knowlesi strain H]
MNQVSAKPKLKTTEFVGGESRGVRFMNRAKGHLSAVTKNVANVSSAANPQFTHKTTFAKNSHLKLRTNNPVFKQPPKSSLKSNQRSSLKVSHVEFAKYSNKKAHHNGDDNGGDMGDGYDNDNAGSNDCLNDDARDEMNDKMHNQMNDEMHHQMNDEMHHQMNDEMHDGVHDDGGREAKPGGTKVPVSNARNATNAEGRKSYLNTFPLRKYRIDKYGESGKTTTIGSGKNNYNRGNPKLGQKKVLSQPQHYEREEDGAGENEWGRKAEDAIYSYSSPMKRKYDTMEKVHRGAATRRGKGSDSDSNSGGDIREASHMESEKARRDTNIQNKRYASESLPHDSGNLHYDNNLNPVNISNGTNEKINAYGSMMLYSNEKLLGSNNTGLGAHPSLNSSGFHGINQENGVLSRSYQPLSTTGGNTAGNATDVNEGEGNVKTTLLGRSYAKFDRLRKGEAMLAAPAQKYQQQTQQQQTQQQQTQQQQGQHLNNPLQYLSKDPRRTHRRSRHTNYITDTNSEKMMNNSMSSHNELFNSCTLDRLSEEKYNSYANKRRDGGMDTQVGDGMDGGDLGINRISSVNRNTASNGSQKFSRLLRNDPMGSHQRLGVLRSDKGVLKNRHVESSTVEFRNMSTSLQYSEDLPLGVGKGGSVLSMRGLDKQEGGDSEDDYYRNVVENITNCSSEENDMNILYKNIVNLNDSVLKMDKENECLDEIIKTNNGISETIRTIQHVVLTRKKVIQDKRNLINEEYELISQKLKECESIFCDSNEGGNGEKKLKVFYEIDEKKNTLKGKYEMKKMLLKKAEYKIEKLQEYTDAVKLKTIAISERYKKTFLLIEELFRLKIIKDTENEVQVCLIPKNTKTNMWHKLQLDKREMTSDACDYLWSQIESFVDKEALNSYL